MDSNFNTNDNQGQFSGQMSDNNIMSGTYEPYQSYQSNQPNQQYQPYQPVVPVGSDETVKISEYLLPLLLCTFIPCVGLILVIVYAFSANEKESKKNFCKAYLITMGINLAVGIILAIVYVALFASILGQY